MLSTNPLALYVAEFDIKDFFPPALLFPDLGKLFTAIIGFAIAAAGVVFFFMLIWGGFKYMTAQGDDKSLQSARRTLTSAAIGLLIIVAAFIIINIVSFVTRGSFIF